ncbi:hypothetical protein GE061_016546 [Apolygus lucorum]|uniref:Uncharacterized protein n=1 Tax=Apolygus lucorum TaxID=248454 RepID=A0A6A4K2W1_APOLU|nr:hypothetical protein GE061_016546 [Apolygus lucorum]
MIDFHRRLSRDVGFHGPGRIYDEDYPMKLEHNKRKQLLQFLFLPGLVLVLAGATLILPYLSKMDGTVLYNSREVNMKLPIPLWYPFPTHEGILSIMAVLGQFMAAGGLSAVIMTLDLIIFRATQAMIFEYKVLRYAIDTLVPRAKRLYAQEYPMMDLESVKMSDDAFQICIGKCLRACVIHHQYINRLLNLYKVMLKWPGFMAYGFGTAVIGLSLINILSAKQNGDYENIVLFFGLSMAEVLNMLMMSVFGELISTESKELRQELYFIEWHNLNTFNRKLMLGFQMGLNNPVIVKVGGLVTVSLETFSSIMNTSYSFFNLVNAQ